MVEMVKLVELVELVVLVALVTLVEMVVYRVFLEKLSHLILQGKLQKSLNHRILMKWLYS